MCTYRSADEVEVCAVAADDVQAALTGVAGAVVGVLPGGGDVLATNTSPTERAAFRAAIDQAVAPYRENGAC